jgi:hypothetical protein
MRKFVLPLALLGTSFLMRPAVATPEVIGFDGALPDFSAVEVESGNVYDYTFASAPVDWRVQSGVWEMTNRWSCSPGWSWFGGRSEEIASIWNKRRFAGDFSVQFYFSFKMGLTKTEKWHYKPSDVAISFCGDGQNLGSGYSFVIGANDNKQSVLMKRGKVVAESSETDALLPSLVDGNPANEVLHRKWWYAKVNRIGNRIECWLDNKLLFTYNDSQPIDAGQIALWTYNNGIMLSRVQIFYENEVKPDFLRKVAAPAKAPAKTVAANPAVGAARR